MKMNAEGMTNHLDDEKHLMNLTLLVNKAAYAVLGCRDSCILTSHAFHHVLSKMGGDAKLTRVTCGVFPEDRNLMANVLGSRGDGSRRPAAEPGMWNGHLVVTLNNKWLLDATLDQANKPDWPEDIHVHPVVVRLEEEFWQGRAIFRQAGTTMYRYSLYPRQVGFANAGDARPSHWRPVADLILKTLLEENRDAA
jgi:hypothetical protein